MFDKRLADALNFTEEDLIANRDGHLTKKQRDFFRMNERSFAIAYLVLVGLFAAICFGVFLIIPRETLVGILLTVAMIGVLAIMLALQYWYQRNVKADMLKGDVMMIEGEIDLQPGEKGTTRLWINDRRFTLYSRPALNPKLQYRVYYLPNTNRLLSVEPISD